MFEVEVSNAFSISRRGTVLVGRVKRGRVQAGDSALLKTPTVEIATHVTGIEVARKILGVASEGEEAGFLCHSIQPEHLAACFVGEGGERRLENVLLASTPRRWWEFWRE